ncbi:MAG: ATP-binding protein [Candidatus Wallbacteria bacterium]|nr:ATP-binding protein [Candidatus Wallbacteria bacterium]
MSKELLKEIIRDFHQSVFPDVETRNLTVPTDSGKIVTIIGPRRAGKSYFLYYLMKKLRIPRENLVYISFEDERLDLKTEELDLILQAYRELYPENDLCKVFFFFDEIQNIDHWDKFIRRVYDSISRHIFITGSNSKSLSREISTALRGRTICYELFPLSFPEYLSFHKVGIEIHSSKNRSLIIRHFQKYLRYGGFPELIRFEDNLKDKILQEYFNTMLFRDIIERYEIKQIYVLKYFIKRLFSSTGREFSINKIFNELKSQGIKIGKNLLYEFLENLENIYLMLILKRYDEKITRLELAEKKIYCIDNGILQAVSFRFSKDSGKILENLVAIELKRRHKNVYFAKNHSECDFIVSERDGIIACYQVCSVMNDPVTRDREIKGLINAQKKFGGAGFIITENEEEVIKTPESNIIVIPAYKFLIFPEKYR